MTDPAPDDDMTAAEYALGTLPDTERSAATLRRTREPGFEALVAAWEARLAPLSEAAAEAEPTRDLWPAILSRIGARRSGEDGASTAAVLALRQKVTRWRWTAGAAMALAAALLLWIGVDTQRRPAVGRDMIAFLQPNGDQPAFILALDTGHNTMSVRPVKSSVPAGKSYELWVIDPSLGSPRSLGVLDPGTMTRRVPHDIPQEALRRGTFAVTVEQPGGSPNGAPTSAPVLFGHLVEAPV